MIQTIKYKERQREMKMAKGERRLQWKKKDGKIFKIEIFGRQF